MLSPNVTVESGASLLLLRCLDEHERDILSTLLQLFEASPFFICNVVYVRKSQFTYVRV